jgi:hypothetical protein
MLPIVRKILQQIGNSPHITAVGREQRWRYPCRRVAFLDFLTPAGHGRASDGTETDFVGE